MARKDKLLRQWVRHGFLPPEAIQGGRSSKRAAHGRGQREQSGARGDAGATARDEEAHREAPFDPLRGAGADAGDVASDETRDEFLPNWLDMPEAQPMDLHPGGRPGNGRPHGRPARRERPRRGSSALVPVLGAIVVLWLGLIGLIVYLKYFAQ